MLCADDLLGSFGEELRWISEAVPQGLRNEAHPREHGTSVFGKE